MKAQDLKNSILQYAIKGELVPQINTEEDSRTLINEIKKLNKDFTKYDQVLKEDEVPFEIPPKWTWVKLGQLGTVKTGTTPKKSNPENFNGNIPFIKPADITNQNIDYKNDSLTEIGLKNGREISENSILMVCIGSIGKCYYTDRLVSCNQQINALTPYVSDVRYLFYMLSTPFFQHQAWANSSSTTLPILNKTKLSNLLIPLAPLDEQKRIVDKIEELFQKIDQYELLEEKLTDLNLNFPTNMERSILQYAMRGNLVPQDSTEGTAQQLLEKLVVDKSDLIRNKVIPKQLEPLPISINETYFDIPDSWEWVRLNQIGGIVSGGTPKSNEPNFWDEEGIIWITPKDMGQNKNLLISKSARKISSLGLEKSSTKLIPKGSIVYSSRAPIGYINIVEKEYTTNQGCKSVVPLVYDKYIYYALKLFTPEIIKNASGTTFKEISGSKFAQTLLPLPPEKEQYRIVEKIEKLLSQTKKLSFL
ncbi:restriction endonuclease subunit S [Staphylococcus xylosus]